MAVTALTDARIWLAEFDLVDDTNEVGLDVDISALDKTNFGSGGKTELVGGLTTTVVSVNGFLNFADDQSDEALSSVLGTADKVATFAADDAAGSTAILAQGLASKLSRGAKVGELSTFSGTLTTSKTPGAVEGVLLAAEQTQTTTTSVAGIQQGAVSAEQSGYAALHVFAASGTSPTLDVTIESDDNAGFTSATTRMTFTQTATATSEWQSVAGAITDDYWRVVATIGGTSPSFTFAVSFGIA